MPLIIAFTCPFAGHLFPFVPILLELRQRGHSVAIAMCSNGTIGPSFAGIRVIPIQWPREGEEAPSDSERDRFAAHGEALARAMDHILLTEQPAFVLVDPTLWGGMVAAEAAGLPWGTLAHNPMLFGGTGLDPRGAGWPPPTTSWGRWRHRMLDLYVRQQSEDSLQEVNRVRTSWGLHSLDQFARMYRLPPLILATTSEPFEYPRTDWPSPFRFVGPMIWEPQAKTIWEPDPGDNRPLVLVAGSTVQADTPNAGWASTVLAALANEPLQIVATLPTERVQEVRGQAKVAIHPTLSHSAVLPRAACVVCHGGPGIVHKALWFGVPVVAIPFVIKDRFEIARRLEVSKAGVMLPTHRLSGHAIVAALRTALERRPGAARISKTFRQQGGAAAAASAIEEQLRAQGSV